MIKQSHPSMERLQRAADSARDLAVQMDDLLKLREAVANAEAALTRQKTEPPPLQNILGHIPSADRRI
jgi:hypothetical protein